MDFHLQPGGRLQGEARVPGDKSISHRAIMLGAVAEGTTRVRGFLQGQDALATQAAFESMGVSITTVGEGELSIAGVGLHGLQAPSTVLDLGNSGTAMRLLAGLLAGQEFACELDGDASLRKRPMQRVIDPLQAMGARIDSAADARPPLRISPCAGLQGIHYPLPMASAQVKSCVLLAGLYARGQTSVLEPAPSRDHTERMLRGFGCPLQRDARGVISLRGGGRLRACDIDVPADISSAAFFLVGAAIADGSDLLLTDVGMNPTRLGVINILHAMGADIRVLRTRQSGAEPVADLHVRSAPLQGIEIPRDQVPLAIDEFPVLSVAAACARGRTVVRGARELRVKESDRIAAIAAGLDTLKVTTEVLEDGIVIEGLGPEGRFDGGAIDSHRDHRIAMAFAVAALRAGDELIIRDADLVATSFPGFDRLAQRLGLRISRST